MKLQYIDLTKENVTGLGVSKYGEAIERARSSIPPGKQGEVAEKIGLAPSAFSACLRKEKPAIMRSIPFCSLVSLLGGEVFYPDEEMPKQENVSLSDEVIFLREYIQELKQIIKEKNSTIEILLKTK